jgi:CheY-like chemotaxis protein
VRLPFAREATAEAQAAPGGEGPQPSPPARRVLVVDDNRDSADSLASLLELSGNEVRIAYEGASALVVAREYRPEVIPLDIGMPGMSGHEVARRLRAQAVTRGALLLAMTGWGQASDRKRSKEAGFDHHLVKPLDLDALDALLTREAPPAPAPP